MTNNNYYNENLKTMAQKYALKDPYHFLEDTKTQEKIKEKIIEEAKEHKITCRIVILDYKNEDKNTGPYAFSFNTLIINLTNYATTFKQFIPKFLTWITSLGFDKEDISIEKCKYSNAINYIEIHWEQNEHKNSKNDVTID